MLDFPDNPQEGTVFQTWQYQSGRWVPYGNLPGGGGGSGVIELDAGADITLTPDPITATGSVAVTSNTYLRLTGGTVMGPLSLLGTATGQTPATSDNSTQLVTSAWVHAQGYSTGGGITALIGDVTAAGSGSVAASVVRLQGQPVAATAPTATNQVLQWSGTQWTPTALAASGITALTGDVTASGTGSVAATVARLQGQPVSATAPTATNQVLQWNGAQWTPTALAAGGITALTGDVVASGSGSVASSVVRLQGQPVSATAPTATNQVLQWSGAAWTPTALVGSSVSITGGTGITVSPSPLTGTGSVALTVPVAIASGGTSATTAPLARAALSVPAISVSDLAPAAPAVGDLWLDGVSMQLYCWVNDGSSSQWIVANNPQAAAKPYLISFSFVGGVPGASQLLGLHKFAKAVTIAANFAAYSGYASEAGGTANATASTVISVERAVVATPNTFSQVGTITFAAGGITPTFLTSGGAAVSCAQGDVLRLVGPATPDATLANPYFTLVGQEA